MILPEKLGQSTTFASRKVPLRGSASGGNHTDKEPSALEADPFSQKNYHLPVSKTEVEFKLTRLPRRIGGGA